MTKRMMLTAAILVVGCYNGMDSSDLEADRQAEIDEIIENLEKAGFPEHEIGVLADGTVYVGDDAVVTLEASREMAGITSNGFRQYRTTNLVDTSVVQTICINPDAAWEADATMLAGLDAAIANYNSQNLQFTMGRDGAGCNAGTADAVIVGNLNGGSGGSAGFPAGGLPYTEINLGSGVGSYGVDVATHVIQHELGHCIGFRHTDYYNRSISCGGAPTDEGDGGVGAIHIPGTPTDAVFNGSVMNSCYNGGSNGVWTAGDITALDCLYDTGDCLPPSDSDYTTNFDTQTNQSASKRTETVYGPYDLTGYEALRVRTAGDNGDADLYVRFGAAPTKNNYDCASLTPSSNEECTIYPTQDGNYYVMVFAYNAYSNMTLTADAAGAGGPPPPPPEVCDDGVDNDGDGATDCADPDCAADPACGGGGGCDNDGVCEAGESCDGRNGTDACGDCPGVTGGKPSNRYCWVEGVCEGPGC